MSKDRESERSPRDIRSKPGSIGVLEHWPAFQDSIAHINGFIRPQVLCRYQADLLNQGAFVVVSPLSGRSVTIARSVLLGNRIAYEMPEQERTWLLSGKLKYGHPISEIVTAADGRCRSVTEDDASEGVAASEAVLQRLARAVSQGVAPPRESGTILLIGHGNFAHHLWNELSALEEWLDRAPDGALERVSLIATAEPLGPLERIFPRLSNVPICRSTQQSVQKDMAHAALVVKIGSCRVSRRIRERIVRFSEEHADRRATAPTLSLLERSWPRLWVSVRLDTRTAENLADFLLCVVTNVLTHYPRSAIVLDGFSFPVSFFEDERNAASQGAFTELATKLAAFIAQFREKVRSTLGETFSSRICSINAGGLLEAIRIGGFCDYYLCHAGTLQHKIAWFHPMFGLIHLPIPDASRAAWHAAQVEGGIVPDLLPKELCVATGPGLRRGDRNFNYRITDVERAAAHVLVAMRSRLGSRRRFADHWQEPG